MLTHPDADLAPDAAWAHILQRGLGIFTESVSDVQLLLTRERARLNTIAFLQGPAGLHREADAVAAAVAAERAANDEQDIIDGLDLGNPVTTARWRDLVAVETPDAVAGFDNALARVGRILGQSRPMSATTDRVRSVNSPGLELIRAGGPFADSLLCELDRQDVGRAFAIARLEPGRSNPRVVFRAHVRVEPDFRCLEVSPDWVRLDGVAQAALRQRVQAWLPVTTVDVVFDNDELADDDTVRLCQRPFDEVNDIDLQGISAAAILEHAPNKPWSTTVGEAADRICELVLDRTDLRELIADAKVAAAEHFCVLEARRQPGFNLDALRQAVSEPCVRIDSLGVYLLADTLEGF